MTNLSPLEFWHTHVGQKLGPFTPEESVACLIPHRTKKGVAPLRIGASGVVYMVSATDCRLISFIELPDQPGLKFIPSGTVRPMKYLAHWMLNEATPPYMVGVMGKASPKASLTITHNERMATFCEANANFYFDVDKIRQAQGIFAPFPWKTVSATLYQYQEYRLDPTEARKAKLSKTFAKHPGLREAIRDGGIIAGSGEHTVLAWLNAEDKQTTEESPA